MPSFDGIFLKGKTEMKKILFFGEPLIRFTPLNNEKINDNVLTSMHYGGSEINIARTLSGLGSIYWITCQLCWQEFCKFHETKQDRY